MNEKEEFNIHTTTQYINGWNTAITMSNNYCVLNHCGKSEVQVEAENYEEALEEYLIAMEVYHIGEMLFSEHDDESTMVSIKLN